jgi:hypothetical protein
VIPPRRDPWTINAHHECGHCVGYLHFRWRFKSVRIWQDRDGQVFGGVLSPAGNYDVVKRAIICMAGPIAEEKLTGVAPEDQTDSAADIAMAREALARRGKDFAVASILPFVRLLVEQQQPVLELISRELIARKELSYEQVVALIEG